jgi:hypothetical protein
MRRRSSASAGVELSAMEALAGFPSCSPALDIAAPTGWRFSRVPAGIRVRESLITCGW